MIENKNIESQASIWRTFFFNRQVEIIYSFIITFIVILVEYASVVLGYFDQKSAAGITVRQTATEFIQTQLAHLSDKPFANNITVIIFWGSVAFALYVSYLVISNAVITLRNEVALNTSSRQGNRRVASLIATKVIVLIIFWIFVACSLRYGISYWLTLVGLFIGNSLQPNNILYFIAGYLGLTANIFLLWVGSKLVLAYEKTL